MGSAKNTGSATRKARIEEMRRADRSRERLRRVLVIVVSAVVVVCLAGFGAWALMKGDDAKGGTDAKPAAGSFRTGSDGVKTWSGKLARNHVAKKVTYPMTPPVGGDHNQVWMNCNGDVYKKPIPNENAVHALEHGAVWVTYTDKADPGDVQKLAAKVRRTPYSLMSPDQDQKDPIMLSAWGHQRTVKSATDPDVASFFSTFVQGKQTPEPGAACTNGLSQ
ncbi:DUF3105 domain-containing protein [Streptomyces sp. NPDC055059]|jgi:hypothetical protein|uniref:DUF3105 domain-containing protein n=1 Tax=Streptomyces sp. NBC_00119 TaxID=2975659 RepID=A0AAU1UEY0_9ACTN|nr:MULTISPECIES: DUF3105 domain-containing protein [unclassified Streptomyces]MCX4645831.1 DUF3105 domain-containing protein [Streptomyces sp. NBC_01446]MCX5318455.1 DUF3105 domain-containing protein [Streptomyces sp. NBC_00120]